LELPGGRDDLPEEGGRPMIKPRSRSTSSDLRSLQAYRQYAAERSAAAAENEVWYEEVDQLDRSIEEAVRAGA